MKQYVPKFRTSECIRATVILAILAGLAAPAPAQLLYQWDFNTAVSSTTVTPTVAAGGGGGLTMSYGGVATDLYGPVGSGVSGGARPNDRAFANNNTTYGTAAASGLAASTAGNINIGVQSKFTMSGWMKADGGFASQSASAAFARIFMIGQGTPDTGSANAATLAIFNNFPSTGQTNALQARLSNILGPNGTDGALSGNNSLLLFGSDWTFFALSVDLTATANNVNFYLGNTTSLNAPVTLSYNNAAVAIGSIDFGTTASALLFNRANGQRGFDGWGDDFRFYSGVLDQPILDGVRADAVPEPTTATLVGLGSLAGFMGLRRRCRN
jgi:PEP-CTERM motif